MMFDGHGWGFGGGFMWLFWILLIAVVVWIVKGAVGSGLPGNGPREKTPLEILEERFARGEIDQEEFEQKRKLLGR